MSPAVNRIGMALKALCQLGPARLAENGVYRLGLSLDWWKIEPPVGSILGLLRFEALPPITPTAPKTASAGLLQDAELILQGKVRLYGGEPVPLILDPGEPLAVWSEYERGRIDPGVEDIKDLWEPARFSWAVTLARAYRATAAESYVRKFWQEFEIFGAANPAYRGPNWISGQEVAIRIITWAFAARVFVLSAESTPERMAQLAQAIHTHACRIPATLIYASSQDNNHLLSEAAGLYTAGIWLRDHPSAPNWRKTGWTWFNRALQRQVEPEGTYIQQSMNYHRLMLQLALWMDSLARQNGEHWPQQSQDRLAAATRWLIARMDPISGRAPNLGHNDGAYLLPFGEQADFRPVAQAAARAFGDGLGLPAGEWDEFSAWLGWKLDDQKPAPRIRQEREPLIVQDSGAAILGSGQDWAMLRAAHFNHRPGQADQLQLDIWHKGQNIALDAGSYRYSSADPWNNGLACAAVHNSVTVDGQEPMTRAGRFLWLDWDQARILQVEPGKVVVERNGYRKLGIRHRRTVCWVGVGGWQIMDELLPTGKVLNAHTFALQWLLPDWPWDLAGNQLRLKGGEDQILIEIACQAAAIPQESIQLIRAGTLLAGKGEAPAVLGWVSETYAMKRPALSLRMVVTAPAPLTFITIYRFRALDNIPGIG